MTRAASFVLAAVIASAAGLQACGCECGDPALRIFVPASRALDVAHVWASGSTCGGDVVCGDAVAGMPLNCSLVVRSEGHCRVEIAFRSGAPSMIAEINFTSLANCCAGFYPSQNFLRAGESVSSPTDAGDATASE